MSRALPGEGGVPPSAGTDPYAPMRPKRGRAVAWAAIVVVMAGSLFAAIAVPGPARQKADWAISDRLLLVGLGLTISAVLWRFAIIEARPSPQGLVIRNLMTTRRLTWPQIVRLQFGGGAPWASVDLDDTDTVAVMAIQRADGEHGRAQAARLAALIQVLSQVREPDRPGETPPPADRP